MGYYARKAKDKMNIDLHCHTKMSDGSTGINELIELAKLRKVEVLSVTDRDTFAGSNRAVVIGKRSGIEVLPGVEISAYDNVRNRKVHVLCYNPKNQDRLEGLLKRISDSRKQAMSISLQKVARLYNLPVDMVITRANSSTNIFKQHIMHALIDAGYTNEIYGAVYNKLFHARFGFALSKIDYPDVFDVIEDIHSAGGVAVMAHPKIHNSMELVEELCEKKLIEGVEAYHPVSTEEDTAAVLAICEKYKIVATGGTDFRGGYGQTPVLLGAITTPEAQYNKIKKL